MTASPPYQTPVSNLKKLMAWYLSTRFAVIGLFMGGTILFHLQQQDWSTAPVARSLSYLALVAILQTLVSIVQNQKIVHFRHFINFQLTWDLLFVIVVIFITGGVNSFYSFFFILIIFAASFFLPRSQVLLVASAASILYGSLLDLQYFGYLPLFNSELALSESMRSYDIFYSVFLHVGAFFLTALLGGTIAERHRRSEEAREQREIDYDELERLNQAILMNINSGLMVVNAAGRIRSFNRAASKITGYRLREVYNRPVDAIFPEFDMYDPKAMARVERGEMLYQKNSEETLTLGYSASPIFDSNNKSLGMLFTFQDLTSVKALEEQLKRNDRLAALGRLASGLAHEIRNPLASISGSVQLLLEDQKIKTEDRHLMEIVVKEADRLSALLSDFLDYARPAPLEPEMVDLAALIDELIELFKASKKFAGETVEKNYTGPIYLKVDPQKLHQVLWDLLLNAGEAVYPSGLIKLDIDSEKLEIIVEDNGPGIDDKDKDKLFEPFFTTKTKGTGLGLANAYANIEAHGGTISVDSGPLGGARFRIAFPSTCRV